MREKSNNRSPKQERGKREKMGRKKDHWTTVEGQDRNHNIFKLPKEASMAIGTSIHAYSQKQPKNIYN